MRNIQRSDIEITAIVMVVLSVILIPYMDWWGLLVGPSLVLMFAWAYYSMVFISWIGDLFKRFTGRA